MSAIHKFSLVFALLVFFSTFATAEEALNVKGEGVKRFEASQTQIGYTSTRIFYTLADQQAVVVIHISNKSKDFPASGSVYQFAKDVTADGLAKWLNNQHSDGLYPEVPEPTAVHKLPATACKTLSSKAIGKTDAGIGTYDQYTVEFQVDEVTLKGGPQLAKFTDSAKVYVPSP